jgi:glyceraldehyde 3-phosphate dehydrogenase
VADGSVTDLVATLSHDVTVDEVNETFRAAATDGPFAGVLVYSEDPIVSGDVVGVAGVMHLRRAAHPGDGQPDQGAGLYDNEWGYTSRLVDLVTIIGGARG